MTALADALARFVERYQADTDLVADMRGWSCGIRLETEDEGSSVYLDIAHGRVVRLGVEPLPYSLVVRAHLQILLDILEFRRDPNEPYLFGELTIQGPEDDFLRLDYVVARSCGS